ncbi:MAG TPA: hypothetical protein DHU59_01880, partial [Clostridiales bacterium]|nr:hypothetical protein [Clostridiales bacterium]
SYMYLMEAVKDREKDFDKYAEKAESSNIKLLSYKINGYEMDATNKDAAIVNLYYKIEIDGETKEVIEKDNVQWNAIRENGIWKIRPDFNNL